MSGTSYSIEICDNNMLDHSQLLIDLCRKVHIYEWAYRLYHIALSKGDEKLNGYDHVDEWERMEQINQTAHQFENFRHRIELEYVDLQYHLKGTYDSDIGAFKIPVGNYSTVPMHDLLSEWADMELVEIPELIFTNAREKVNSLNRYKL